MSFSDGRIFQLEDDFAHRALGLAHVLNRGARIDRHPGVEVGGNLLRSFVLNFRDWAPRQAAVIACLLSAMTCG